MKRLKTILAGAAMVAGAYAVTGTAQAATYVCGAAGTCSFDGTTGGFSNVRRSAGATASDTFKITLPTAGQVKLTFTTANLTFLSASFNGVNFTPVAGVEKIFNIAAGGTYDLLVSVKNNTSRVASYSSTIDFVAVPEPAAWGMMIAGVGMAGAALRRRRRAPRAAMA